MSEWMPGIDESHPYYGFIGVVGGNICQWESMTPEEARSICEAHNADLTALHQRLAEAEAENRLLRQQNDTTITDAALAAGKVI